MRDLVCFSHLRWAFVHQRPQHLMSRAARDRRVWFLEEPVPGPRPVLKRRMTPEGVVVCVPEVPAGLGPDGAETVTAGFLAELRLPPSLARIEAHDIVVRMLGEVALVHARTTFLREGRPAAGRYTDVWALRGGRWLAVAAHVTRV